MAGTWGTSPLHERHDELAALDAALARARGGDGAVVVVEGPPGIGKTRLLTAAADLAHADGVAVLDARGAEFERDEPYSIVRQLLERDVLAATPERRAALLAGAAEQAERVFTGRADFQGDAWTVLHGLYWLVANRTAEGPLLLLADDLHWADAPSARFLAYLARRSADLPLALVCAVRPREIDEQALHELPALPHTTVLHPRPLTPGATEALLADSFDGGVDAAFVVACQDASGGNPFLLRELVAALRAEGIEPTAATAQQVGELRPAATRRALALRLATLPQSARDLAAAVAVLGGTTGLRTAAAVAGMDEQEAASGVAALVRTEVFADELPLSFRHPLLRAAVHADLDPARRTELHERAVDVLLALDERPERVAHHLLAVEPRGDTRRWEVLVAAGEAATHRGAPDAALGYLRRALAEPPPPAGRPQTLTLLGMSAAQVAATGEAQRWLREAIAVTPDAGRRAELWLTLARVEMTGLSMVAGVATAREGLDDLEGADELAVERLRTEMVCQAATHPDTASLADDLVPGMDAPPGDTPAERLQLLRLVLGEARGAGTAQRTVELSLRAMGDGALIAEETAESLVIPQLLYHLVFSDACAPAVELCEGLAADARARGTTWGTVAAAACLAWVRLREGDVRAGEADARRALATAHMLPAIAQPFTAAGLITALTWGGHLDEAEELAAEAFAATDDRYVHAAMLHMARGWLRRAQRRHADALEDFLEHGRRVTDVHWDVPPFGWRAEAAEQLVLLDRRAEALELAEEQLRLGRRWGAPTGIAAGLRATGLARGPDGLDALGEAVAVLDGSPVRLERVRTLLALGQAQRRANARRAASETLTEALDVADRCGAAWMAGRVEEELHALGLRPRTRRRSGPEALTASERRVCELAASGMSNREIAQELFVTAKTVENHLGRAYHKLGIGSREELGVALGATAV